MRLIEYLQSSGTQYIDSNFQDDSGSRVELEFEVVSLLSADYNNNYVYGNAAKYTNGQSSAYVTLANGSNKNNIGVMNNNVQYNYEQVVLNKRYAVRANFTPNAQSAVINGDTLAVTPSSYTLGACSIALFCAKSVENYSGYYHGKCAIKLYYCRIYDHENNLVRDYIPVIDDNDVPCLWDNVASAYKYNDGSGSFTAGPEIVDAYTILYNANGGSGSMADQTAYVDEYTNLSLCSFYRSGFEFVGWALSASGPAVYSDGEEVVNLAAADETVTLYAVWEKPQLKCTLQFNKSENNRAVKDLENIREFNFILKDQTSIIDPVFLITGDITDMLQANYMTVPAFGRAYFITDIQSVRTGLVEISAHVDVLSSYIDALKECSAVIHRQENKWNLYLDDGFFKTYQNPNIVVKKFPSGFTDQSFVLAVAGN